MLFATHVVSDIDYIAKNIILLKQGEVAAAAPLPDLLERISGKVWTVLCAEGEMARLCEEYRVTSVQKSGRGAALRVLCDEEPRGVSASPAAPTLDDYYLMVFGSGVDVH